MYVSTKNLLQYDIPKVFFLFLINKINDNSLYYYKNINFFLWYNIVYTEQGIGIGYQFPKTLFYIMSNRKNWNKLK